MKTFKKYLEEKILFSDIEDIRQHIFPALKKLFGNKRLTGYMFYEILNKYLNDLNVVVSGNDNIDRVTGGLQKDGSVHVYIPSKFYKLVRNNNISQDKFFYDIANVIEHELIHKKQKERARGHTLVPKYKWWAEKTPEWWKQYLSDKNEIMAFARSMIEYYKADGLSRNEIKTALKTLDINKYPNRVLEKYLETFDRGDPVLKRLLSYSYQYNEAL